MSKVVLAAAIAVALIAVQVFARSPSRFPTDLGLVAAGPNIVRNYDQFCVPIHVFREKTIPPEFLQLKTNSSKRGIALFFTAEYDHNGALDPSRKIPFMHELNKEYNFKQVTTRDWADLCNEIDWAAKYGDVEVIVLHSHMTPVGFKLSEVSNVTFASEFRRCFENASENARVILLGCRAGEGGGPRRDSLARWISDSISRWVFAPTSVIYNNQIQLVQRRPIWVSFHDGAEDPGMVYRPAGRPPSQIEGTEREQQRRLCQEYEWRLEGAAGEGDLGLVQRLLEEAPTFITRTARGNGMVRAARNGHTDVVEALLANGPTHARLRGEAIQAAARGKHWHIADILLRSGPLPYYGRSEALVEAARQGHLDLVEKLLANGTISQYCLQRAVLAAVETGDVRIMKALLAKGPISLSTRGEAVRLAIPHLQEEILECLLASGPISLDAQIEAIHLANWAFDRVRMLYLLLSRFQISIEVRNDAVIRAVCLGHRTALETLLDSGPISEETRERAIIQATLSGREDIVDMLSLPMI